MFKTIVVGQDGTEDGERAMALARTIAEEAGAHLVVVHVTELVGGKGGVHPLEIDESDIKARIATEVANLRQSGASAELVTETASLGGPAHMIATQAEASHADLIVVGSRGRTAVSQLILGSVPLRLLHIAHCPVLIVPPTQHDK
jgi:nucleotide-binding universal stress UspA family protein